CHLGNGAVTVRNVTEYRGGDDDVERIIGQRQGAAIALLKGDDVRHIGGLGELASRCDERRTRIDADDPAVRPYAPRDISRDDSAAASDVENTLPRPDLEERQVFRARRDLVIGAGAVLQSRDEIPSFVGRELGGIAKETRAAVFRTL